MSQRQKSLIGGAIATTGLTLLLPGPRFPPPRRPPYRAEGIRPSVPPGPHWSRFVLTRPTAPVPPLHLSHICALEGRANPGGARQQAVQSSLCRRAGTFVTFCWSHPRLALFFPLRGLVQPQACLLSFFVACGWNQRSWVVTRRWVIARFVCTILNVQVRAGSSSAPKMHRARFQFTFSSPARHAQQVPAQIKFLTRIACEGDSSVPR